jgi:membrane-bound lytic murein transglycosylase A
MSSDRVTTWRRVCAALPLLALLASCADQPDTEPAATQAGKAEPASLQLTSFDALPGWHDDPVAQAMPALRLQCARLALLPADTALGGAGLAATYGGMAGQWADACAAARAVPSGADAHDFFETWFQPYRAATDALVTGYFEPLIPGSLKRFGAYQTPVLGRPADLREGTGRDAQGRPVLGRMEGDTLVPYYTRAEIEAGAAGDNALPIAWVTSPIDLFFAQIQGSVLLQLPQGGTYRLAFAARNGRAYTPIGRILEDEHILAPADVSLQTIRAWLVAHPGDAKKLMDRNEAYVFFRPAPDSSTRLGPPGALGVSLTAGRSAAVDKRSVPLGLPLFIATSVPDGRVWQHLVLAQDLGSAIEGPARVDVYLGAGAPAEAWAGRMHQQGQLWLLLPRPTAGSVS